MYTLKKHETKRQYLSRLRSKARLLHARVYTTPEGRLLLVRGQPDPQQMYRYLAHLDAPSSHIVTPADIGFPRNMVEEATASLLTSSGRALTKWSRTIAKRNRRRRVHDDQAAQREINKLESRLRQLHEWKRLSDGNCLNDKSPWMLDDGQESTLETLLHRFCLNSEVIQRYDWLARLVMWTAGGQATARFCNAALLLGGKSPEVDARKLLRASLAKLDIWLKRSACENWRGIQREMRQWIRQLPPRVIVRAGLSSKLQGKVLPDRIEEQQTSCKKALRECNDGSKHRIAAAIATIVLSDNSSAPIPQHLVQHWIETSDDSLLQRSALGLIAEAKQPAYDKLLHALDELRPLPLDDLQFVRQQLCLSQSVQDIEWIVTHGLQYNFEDTALRANWARRQIERLSRVGIELSSDQIQRLLGTLHSTEDREVLVGFIDWTASLPITVRTPRVCQLIVATLFDFYLPGISDLKSHGKLRSWFRSTKVKPNHLASDTNHWTKKIYHCQETIGLEQSLPKTVRNLLEVSHSRRREYEHLLTLDRSGLATHSQVARMRYLCNESSREGGISSRKLLRAIQDTYIHIAIEALRHAIRLEAEATVGERMALRLVSTSLRRLLQFAGWIREMTVVERRLLDEVLLAHELYGADYKRTLEINERWINAALAQGIDVNAWLKAEPSVVDISDKKIRIELSSDPVEVFLMGSYFDTCLSLGRENQMAVLANASDANKQVVFLRDEHDRVLGRQLLTLSHKYGLLGYYCYLNEEGTNEDRREALTAAVATSCGRLAQRCGVQLAEEGEPESLGEHFWYDDEPIEWHKAAHNAILQSTLTSDTFDCIADSIA